jgi:hypothetical protein
MAMLKVIKYYVVKIRTLICGFKIDKSYAVNEARSCLRWLAEKDTVVVGCQRFDSDFTGEGQRQQ